MLKRKKEDLRFLLLPRVPVNRLGQDGGLLFRSPIGNLRRSLVGVDFNVLVRNKGVAAHANHECKGASHNDNQRISRGIREEVFLAVVNLQ